MLSIERVLKDANGLIPKCVSGCKINLRKDWKLCWQNVLFWGDIKVNIKNEQLCSIQGTLFVFSKIRIFLPLGLFILPNFSFDFCYPAISGFWKKYSKFLISTQQSSFCMKSHEFGFEHLKWCSSYSAFIYFLQKQSVYF